ncbi:meiotic recombination protein W68 isoform X2 [Manduca sexta]|uniref:meiotic recombination protein W68 isoform X2 n=1 Tax=Manduca sexta TaxID=7130 RepID=UPI00188DC837|nr:meiotic recombination protein W68 isoform X2 [Manduca sexta]
MDLLNTEAAMLKELVFNRTTSFKQEPKLVSAIDKLLNAALINRNVDEKGNLLLPERKLEFSEVQQILQQSSNRKVAEKSSDLLLKEGNDARKMFIKKIEDILTQINSTAENGDVPKLIIRNQRIWSNCIYDLDREMFYQNISRFRSQANLDIAVRDVCCLLETPPWSLGIVATAKGLIAGPLTLHYHDGNIIDCMVSGGTLIPQDVNGVKKFQSTAKYILVVEKDAIFQKLLDEGALLRLGPVIIITGKGYPDVCTRQLLCRLCNELNLNALALVDADPHGYEIFLTYKYGSLAQSHLSASLACSSLLLLGVRHHDVMTLAPDEARLPLSNLDKRKLEHLIRRPYLENAVGLCIKEELNSMLTSGIKAEIEAVAPNSGALCDAYLPSKIILSNYLG